MVLHNHTLLDYDSIVPTTLNKETTRRILDKIQHDEDLPPETPRRFSNWQTAWNMTRKICTVHGDDNFTLSTNDMEEYRPVQDMHAGRMCRVESQRLDSHDGVYRHG